MNFIIKNIITCILLLPPITNAEPKLFSSDWPVWNITEGMNENHLLDDFSYQEKEYESTLKWFKAGNLEVTFMTLYDFISIQPTKDPTIILGVTDYSHGGDKIILRKEIKQPTDLIGKKILLASNTISLWLLHNYLNQNGMSLDDVIIINENPDLAPLHFKEDKSFAAIVGWNPTINAALSEDSYIASTSGDFPRVIYDLIVAKKDFVDKNPILVEKFLNSYFDSILNPSVLEKTAENLSVSVAEYKSWLEDAYIFSSRQSANAEYKHLLENAEKILNFLTNAPKSIHHQDTLNNFKQRSIELKPMINFSPPQ